MKFAFITQSITIGINKYFFSFILFWLQIISIFDDTLNLTKKYYTEIFIRRVILWVFFHK